QQTLEDLLLNHPLDCPVCDKAGECLLQDYSYQFGRSTSRMIDPKNTPPNKPYIGDNVTLFTDRCILCSRCVRFTWEISGTAVLPAVRGALRAAAQRYSGSVVGVVSPFLTCEEAYLFARFNKGLSGQARLALGPVPVIGEDDTYPKDRKGRPVQPVKFTIRAEKCPNKRGVQEVLKHFQREVISFDAVVNDAAAGRVKALYLSASYARRRGGWVDEQ